MMRRDNRGPESVLLVFVHPDMVSTSRSEAIVMYSLRDRSLYDPATPDAAWLAKLLGDLYSWEGISNLAVDLKGTRSVLRDGREYRVVDYSASYHLAMHKVDYFDRGVLYVMKSPRDTWQGLLVFGVTEASGKPQTDLFPTREAASALADVMSSLNWPRGIRDVGPSSPS
jgi:hypothetical protein